MLRIKAPNQPTNHRRSSSSLSRSTTQLIFCFFLILSSLFFALPSTAVHAAQVTLAWDRNAESNVEGYKVYYGTASRNYDWFIDVGDVTTITITDLADGFTYYFAATAYDNASPPLESTYSDEVSKSTCSYSISPTSASFSASGGTGSVSVSTQAGCPWTASTGASWMTITSGSSGTGNGTVNHSVAANTSGSSRTSSSTMAGRVFTVTQAAAATYTITASAGTGGSISPSGAVSVSHEANRTFTITANTGYTIANVLVDGSSVGAVTSYTFSNVTAAHTISATFSVRTYTITASAGTGGTISPSGSVSVNYGASQTFAIAASTGYQIASVTVNGVSQGAISSYTFSNVTAAHTISATFSANTYIITASAGSGGSISPSGSVSVSHGSNRTFTISASTGYTIANVLVDGASVGAVSSYTFNNVTANHTISATFTANSYTITASAGTGGSISPSGSFTVNHGASQTFVITPNTSYGVTNVLVDGVSVGAVSSYTFNNVVANHTISASFAVNTYTINATAGTGGTISPSGAIPVSGGANQTFTISANSGYRIADVLVDGSSLGALNSFTFTNVNSSHTISASFTANTYNIVASAGVGGSISPSGTVAVNHGANRTFTISPNTGFVILNVLVDGSSVGTVSSYTFSNVTADHTISAIFAVRTYTLTASAGIGGSISPSGSTSVNHGANQTFTITPNTGYRIATVRVNGVWQGVISSYTFSNVTTNHTISATFIINSNTINASAGSGGSISPSGAVTVTYGSNQTFTITPAGGYAIANVLVDGVSQGPVSSYVFSNVTTAHTIRASFSPITFVVQASAGTGGSISPSGIVTVNAGANQTFTITPDSGYLVSDVQVDGSSVGAVGSYTFTNISSSHIITASFVEGYTLTVATAGTGVGVVTTNPATTTFSPGTKVTLRALKNVSSIFAGFSGDCTTKLTSCTITMNKNASVTARFNLKLFRVKTKVIGGGTFTVQESAPVQDRQQITEVETINKTKGSTYEAEVDYGEQITYNIMPEPGNYIKRVTVDGKPYGPVTTLTFSDVKRNHKVKIRFEAESQPPPTQSPGLISHQLFLRDEDVVATDDDHIETSPTNQYASVIK